MRQVALEHDINAGPPVVMVLTGQSASEMEPWRYGSKIWTMVMTIVQNTDCNKLNWSNFIQVNLALCHSVRNELREYLHLVCFAYIFVNTSYYCSNWVFKSDRSWPVIWPVLGIMTCVRNQGGDSIDILGTKLGTILGRVQEHIPISCPVSSQDFLCPLNRPPEICLTISQDILSYHKIS